MWRRWEGENKREEGVKESGMMQGRKGRSKSRVGEERGRKRAKRSKT